MGFAGDVQCVQVGTEEPGDHPRRHPIHHQMIGEVRQRVTESGQLPVEHGNDSRLRGMKYHVVAAKIAVHDASLIARRNMPRQPVDHTIHVRVAPGIRIAEILLRPARDLPLKIISCAAVVGQTDGGEIHGVQPCESRVHGIEIPGPLLSADLRERGVPENASRHQVHHVEPRADDRGVGAQGRRTSARGNRFRRVPPVS